MSSTVRPAEVQPQRARVWESERGQVWAWLRARQLELALALDWAALSAGRRATPASRSAHSFGNRIGESIAIGRQSIKLCGWQKASVRLKFFTFLCHTFFLQPANCIFIPYLRSLSLSISLALALSYLTLSLSIISHFHFIFILLSKLIVNFALWQHQN